MKKSFKNFRCILFLLVAVILTLSGCQNFSAIEKSNSSQTVEDKKEAQTITVTDQIGRTVTLPQNTEKIVSTYYISTSLLIALGAKDKVVGIEMKADTREIYKRAAPEFLELPAVGSGKGINIEEIALLSPDVVILPLKLKDSVSQLEELNIAVVVIDPETMEGFEECIALIGKISGCEQRASALLSYYAEKMDFVQQKTSAMTNLPSVYISSGSDFLRTCTQNMYQNDLITLAGGRNVSSQLTDGYWQAISAEELINWNPEKIMLVGYADYTKESVLEDERFQMLDAVKTKSIYSFPSSLEAWDYPTPSSVLGALWLLNNLHLELYSTEDYIAESKSFYQYFYGIEVSEEDLGL